MRSFGPKELLEDVHKKDLCVGCGACVGLCPYFESHKGKIAMLFPCDIDRGRCYAYCPKAEVDLDYLAQSRWGTAYEGDGLGHHLAVVKARAGDKAPTASFQTGGTVSSLIAFALHTGIIDAAVLTGREGLVPVPCLVTAGRDVAACASSKYTAAPTLSAFNRAVREGYRKIGVVGTPCHVTALAKIRANPLEKEDFKDPLALVIGLFCTWSLDTRRLTAFLSGRIDLPKVRKMDIPPPPAEVLMVETDDGKHEIPLSEIRPLIPHGCTVCPDMTAEWADLSVGVMEGDSRWNTLIIRTEEGQALANRAADAGWLLREAVPAAGLTHLGVAAANKKKRTLRAALEQGLVNGGDRSCVRVNPRALEKMLNF